MLDASAFEIASPPDRLSGLTFASVPSHTGRVRSYAQVGTRSAGPAQTAGGHSGAQVPAPAYWDGRAVA